LLEANFLGRVFVMSTDRVVNVKLSVARMCARLAKEREFPRRELPAASYTATTASAARMITYFTASRPAQGLIDELPQ